MLTTLLVAAIMMSFCAQDAMDPETDVAATPVTRAFGDKTPIINPVARLQAAGAIIRPGGTLQLPCNTYVPYDFR